MEISLLPGTKDSFSNFKVDKFEGFAYLNLLDIEVTTRSELRNSDGKQILLGAEKEISVLVWATKPVRFHTGSASAIGADGNVIQANPQWIKVAKRTKAKSNRK